MEAGEESSSNTSLKRPRVPLSDSEDNVFTQPEENDGQKRRRLEAAGQENRSPKASTSGRRVELEMKPDTPMVPSVRSRVNLLTQRPEGVAPLAQRCLSDPGAVSSSLIIQEKGFRENLLGEGEFNQRMERFKVPVFEASPASTQSSANPCPRSCSNFVSDIQHKLQGATTPSSKQAVRMRQEREKELSQLQFQPISENAWLKRSSSDPSLTQAADNAEMKDDSFTGATTSSAKKQTLDGTGKTPCCDSDVPASSAGPENSHEQLKVKQKEQNTHQGEEVGEDMGYVASFGSEIHSKSLKPQTQTVLKLSFSEDQSFSSIPLSEEQNVSELPTGEDQSLLECISVDEFNTVKSGGSLRVDKKVRPERILVEDTENNNCSVHHEEGMETSTDEEQPLWRYPSESKEESVLAQQQEEGDVSAKEEEAVFVSGVEQRGGGAADHRDFSRLLYADCDSENVSAEIDGSSEMMEDDKPEGDKLRSESSLDDHDQESMESSAGCSEGEIKAVNSEACSDEDDESQEQKETQTVGVKEEDVDADSDSRDSREIQASHVCLEKEKTEQAVIDERQDDVGGTHEREGGDSSKKVSFILEHELLSDQTPSDTSAPLESRIETRVSDSESSSHDETNTAEIIDQMFEEVLEYAGRIEEERVNHGDIEDHDSGIGACSRDNFQVDVESEKEKEKSEAEGEVKAEKDGDESNTLENDEDDMLTFPPSAILSPLSKSVEAVVTPMRIVVESNPPSLPLTPEESLTPPAESALLYSIDAYRTQSQGRPSTIQNVTPEVQRQAPETSQPQPSVDFKEKMKALNEEAGKLQTVISQTLQALSCCTDEEHGQGSLVEAEAEKLLLVSCEKRSALLAEMARLREERNSESGKAAGKEKNSSSQQPCRGTVSITNIQLPLKVEYVCSSLNRSGRPSHYFFLLIRYGPCNIVATPLATAADAKNGDTISFPTSVTLKDIRSTFEIDVEVYSLSNNSGNNCTMDRTATKSRVTPRKLLNTITRSSNSLTTAALAPLNTRRSSNFSLVGSHKISLASLGHTKFPLDKMKLEGKIRRLLGDEFQEKVPFLSPLEGNIYLRLESESHSNVQHQGFLTMFELISGFGVWHRRYFVLEGCDMYYWNHPNDRETKRAEGSISLSSSHSECVRPVERDSCARPFTFELVNNPPHQQQQENSHQAKCWFSADTKQERLDWMEKLNQVLLDFHTWNRTSAESQRLNESSSGNLRESIL